MRVGWNALHLTREPLTREPLARGAQARAFDLIAALAALPAGTTVHEVALQARVPALRPASRPALREALALRLVIGRKTPEATEATRRQLRAAASRKQRTPDPRSLVAAEFMILGTSLAADAYPAEETLAVYRLRWQIELASRRLKSLLRMDRLPAHTPRASRSWLTAHLIMALLCDDLSQDSLDVPPWGDV